MPDIKTYAALRPYQDTVTSPYPQSSAPELSREDQALLWQYRQDGFLVHDFGFDPALIEDCATATKAFHGDYARVQDLWRVNKAVKALAAHPDVLKLLRALYIRRPFPFQTLNFPVGTQQKTHSDSFFFNAFPERYMCGVWVALEDIDMENGPLHYYKGSHDQPVRTKAEIDAYGYDDPSQYFEAAAANYEKHYGTIRKGEAVIWSANILHGGEPIKDPARSRLSQVTHYYFDDCVYWTPELSRPEIGELQLRRPYDIAKGRFIDCKYQGQRIKVSMRERWQGPWYNLKKFVPKWK